MRISKTFEFRNINGTFQIEEENKEFLGDQNYKDSYSTKNWTDDIIMEQNDRGWSGVIRYEQKSPVVNIDVFRVEFGMRKSNAFYSHDQEINIYDGTTLVKLQIYEFEKNTRLNTSRLGMYMEGKRENGNKFEVFFNQGTNQRLPTLNDRFNWGIGVENLEDYYIEQKKNIPQDPRDRASHDLKLQELKIVLASMKSGLKREYVSTTELSGKIKYDKAYIKPFSSFDFGISIFRNSYLDRIAYRSIPNNMMAPFNTSTSWINGLELSVKTFTWDNRIQISISKMWTSPSDELIFPETPSSRSSAVLDINYGILHFNMSNISQGPQKFVRGGALLDQNKSFSNTNLTISAKKQFWFFNTSLSYTVRNLFSDTSAIVNADNISPDGNFNYFDAHRQLITLKVSLQKN